jgi:predicted XRE-type DNA-binding protein
VAGVKGELIVKKVPAHRESSGNVFEDLGLPNAPELQVKADLAFEIMETIGERGLTQSEAADILGVDQPKISALVRGRLSGFSMERLYRFLNALGKDVEIVVRPASGSRGKAGLRVTRPRSRAASARQTTARPQAARRPKKRGAKK